MILNISSFEVEMLVVQIDLYFFFFFLFVIDSVLLFPKMHYLNETFCFFFGKSDILDFLSFFLS